MVEDRQDLGLAVLTSSAVFGSWSAWNSSLFTAATFVDTQEKYVHAKLAMDLGLATAFATGLGVHFVYGEKGRMAAVAAIATGVLLYAAYYCKLRANPKLTGYMMGGKNNGNGKDSQLLNGWKPLSNQEIQYVKNLIEDGNGISVVSEP